MCVSVTQSTDRMDVCVKMKRGMRSLHHRLEVTFSQSVLVWLPIFAEQLYKCTISYFTIKMWWGC